MLSPSTKSLSILSTIFFSLSLHATEYQSCLQISGIQSGPSSVRRALERLQKTKPSLFSPSRHHKELLKLIKKIEFIETFYDLQQEVLNQLMNKKGWRQYKKGSYTSITKLISEHAANQPIQKQRLLEIMLTHPKTTLQLLGNKHATALAKKLTELK